ncbi:hypothetical protein IHE44_0000472 [Lamprotornis superbus]|uniref:Uncharacterized protein n=1 Tax=Lamprotornis superbus TaxID=245042 RepID=A0A835NU03_9PASS|nr:hypothetical protein IHE44_0000472 [Lamprotornis superbus]
MDVHRFRDIERTPEYLQPEKCVPPPSHASLGTMWFIRDGCGIACAVVTWMLVFYADFVVLLVMLVPSRDYVYSVINGTLFNTLAFLALASHFRAMLTDPGAVPKGNATKEFIESLQLKPGQMYIALISLHALIMVGFHFLYCFEEDWTTLALFALLSMTKKCSSFSPPTTVILLILLCFEALLFLIFTSVMFGTQVHSICTDETVSFPLFARDQLRLDQQEKRGVNKEMKFTKALHAVLQFMGIERLKNQKPTWEKISGWEGMKLAFGGAFSLGWFNPFSNLNCESSVPAEGKQKSRVKRRVGARRVISSPPVTVWMKQGCVPGPYTECGQPAPAVVPPGRGRRMGAVTFGVLVLRGDVFPPVLPHGFCADVLADGLGLRANLEVFLLAVHLLDDPVDSVSVHFRVHKLAVVNVNSQVLLRIVGRVKTQGQLVSRSQLPVEADLHLEGLPAPHHQVLDVVPIRVVLLGVLALQKVNPSDLQTHLWKDIRRKGERKKKRLMYLNSTKLNVAHGTMLPTQPSAPGSYELALPGKATELYHTLQELLARQLDVSHPTTAATQRAPQVQRPMVAGGEDTQSIPPSPPPHMQLPPLTHSPNWESSTATGCEEEEWLR